MLELMTRAHDTHDKVDALFEARVDLGSDIALDGLGRVAPLPP
jgi:hypothetical protein